MLQAPIRRYLLEQNLLQWEKRTTFYSIASSAKNAGAAFLNKWLACKCTGATVSRRFGNAVMQPRGSGFL